MKKLLIICALSATIGSAWGAATPHKKPEGDLGEVIKGAMQLSVEGYRRRYNKLKDKVERGVPLTDYEKDAWKRWNQPKRERKGDAVPSFKLGTPPADAEKTAPVEKYDKPKPKRKGDAAPSYKPGPGYRK